MIEKYGRRSGQGGLRDGQGHAVDRDGRSADQDYSFAKRFGDEKGTNPEELIGAAHASCFAMQMSAYVEQSGTKATRIDARSTVTLTVGSGGADITRVHVDVTAEVPGMSADAFRRSPSGPRRAARCPRCSRARRSR
jgi:osmotically inducible protein OsmC